MLATELDLHSNCSRLLDVSTNHKNIQGSAYRINKFVAHGPEIGRPLREQEQQV
jgi:hypothetical protein